MTIDKLRGVIVPVVTPLTDSGQIDREGLRSLVSRCADAGAVAVFAGGSAGTGPLLPDSQWEEMLEIVADEAKGKITALAGIIATSTNRAKEQIAVSQRLGYQQIVVTPTFYISLTRDEEMIAHFQACRDATDQDILIYNIPSCTGSTISLAAVRQMTEAGWAVAIKESSGDPSYFRQLQAIANETGVALLQGNETDICWSLAEGAAGIVPVCANYDPEMFVDIYNAATSKEQSETFDAKEAQNRINALRETLLVGDHNWIAGITWGLHTQGIGSGIPPLPLLPPDEGRKKLIEGLEATNPISK